MRGPFPTDVARSYGVAPEHRADDEAWPPPPHDPRERALVLEIDGWEVRLFGARRFGYFVTRGLWHAQLWSPRARVSVLTPSRLTLGDYEVFPIHGWKARAPDPDGVAELLRAHHAQRFVDRGLLAWIERTFVIDLARAPFGAAS